MTFKRFMLSVVFLVGVALGWGARGANDGGRVESEVKVEVEKAKAVEAARWEKEIRDLNRAKSDLQDKLAVASAKDAIIANKLKEIDELKAKVAAAEKPATTPAAEPAKTPEEKQSDAKTPETSPPETKSEEAKADAPKP